MPQNAQSNTPQLNELFPETESFSISTIKQALLDFFTPPDNQSKSDSLRVLVDQLKALTNFYFRPEKVNLTTPNLKQIVIEGPTGAGKTSVTVTIAEKRRKKLTPNQKLQVFDEPPAIPLPIRPEQTTIGVDTFFTEDKHPYCPITWEDYKGKTIYQPDNKPYPTGTLRALAKGGLTLTPNQRYLLDLGLINIHSDLQLQLLKFNNPIDQIISFVLARVYGYHHIKVFKSLEQFITYIKYNQTHKFPRSQLIVEPPPPKELKELLLITNRNFVSTMVYQGTFMALQDLQKEREHNSVLNFEEFFEQALRKRMRQIAELHIALQQANLLPDIKEINIILPLFDPKPPENENTDAPNATTTTTYKPLSAILSEKVLNYLNKIREQLAWSSDKTNFTPPDFSDIPEDIQTFIKQQLGALKTPDISALITWANHLFGDKTKQEQGATVDSGGEADQFESQVTPEVNFKAELAAYLIAYETLKALDTPVNLWINPYIKENGAIRAQVTAANEIDEKQHTITPLGQIILGQIPTELQSSVKNIHPPLRYSRTYAILTILLNTALGSFQLQQQTKD